MFVLVACCVLPITTACSCCFLAPRLFAHSSRGLAMHAPSSCFQLPSSVIHHIHRGEEPQGVFSHCPRLQGHQAMLPAEEAPICSDSHHPGKLFCRRGQCHVGARLRLRHGCLMRLAWNIPLARTTPCGGQNAVSSGGMGCLEYPRNCLFFCAVLARPTSRVALDTVDAFLWSKVDF